MACSSRSLPQCPEIGLQPVDIDLIQAIQRAQTALISPKILSCHPVKYAHNALLQDAGHANLNQNPDTPSRPGCEKCQQLVATRKFFVNAFFEVVSGRNISPIEECLSTALLNAPS